MNKKDFSRWLLEIIIILFALVIFSPAFGKEDNQIPQDSHVLGTISETQSNNLQKTSTSNVCDLNEMMKENSKLKIQYKGKNYYFCGDDCAKLFRENPKYYVTKIKTINFKASQFKFNPATITVNKNDIVQLIITSSDVTHGVDINAYDINVPISKGEKKVIEFLANKPGVFKIFCSVYCGIGHHNMKATLNVKQ